MHRIVIFSSPVTSCGVDLYGKLYSGATIDDIVNTARADFRTLLVREQWEGEQGEAFRHNENWIPVQNDDGSGWWSYDESKYTYNLGYGPVPDQFAQTFQFSNKYVALVSGWVPLKMADTDNEDYIINRVFYYMISDANPDDICWYCIDETEDDLPFQ